MRVMGHHDLDDPNLALHRLMTLWPGTIGVFLRHRMLCVGCLAGPFCTVRDACRDYGLDEDAFRAELLAASRT